MTDKTRARCKTRYEELYKPAYDAWIQYYPFTTDTLDGEQWRDVDGYEEFYQVSNFGRVKSFRHYPEGKILKPNLSSNGYAFIRLGREKAIFIHVLVARAFIPNSDDKPQVNHIDGHKLNNYVDNLEWVTKLENEQHSWATGLRGVGENHHNSKLTKEQTLYIRDNPDNLPGIELAAKFSVSKSTISQIQTGMRRKFEKGRRRETKTPPSLPNEKKEQIRQEYQKSVRGFGTPALAKKYGCSKTTIWHIIKGN